MQAAVLRRSGYEGRFFRKGGICKVLQTICKEIQTFFFFFLYICIVEHGMRVDS